MCFERVVSKAGDVRSELVGSLREREETADCNNWQVVVSSVKERSTHWDYCWFIFQLDNFGSIMISILYF